MKRGAAATAAGGSVEKKPARGAGATPAAAAPEGPPALPANLSLEALRAFYGAGGTVAAVVELAYATIKKRGNDAVWIHLLPKADALAAAAALEARPAADRAGLPLFGVPFGVKDNIDCLGLPTTAACKEFAYLPAAHAPAVGAILAAGGLCIGKTNLDQFATGLVGMRSPYGAPSSVFSAQHISGGSSSGSAVCVAAGEATFALGTDTAGSGRVPAMFNNIVGLKPTKGLVSVEGVVPACHSLDCVSIFALSVADAQEVLRVIAVPNANDELSRALPPTAPPLGPPVPAKAKGRGKARDAPSTLAGFRFCVPPDAQLVISGPHAVEMRGLFEAAVQLLHSLGGMQVPAVDDAEVLQRIAAARAGPVAALGWLAARPLAQLQPGGAAEPASATAGGAAASEGAAGSKFNYAIYPMTALMLYQGPCVAERAAAVGSFLAAKPDAAFDPTVKAIIAGAGRYSAADCYNASYTLAALKKLSDAQLLPRHGPPAPHASADVNRTVHLMMVPTAPRHWTKAEVTAEPVSTNSLLGTYTNFVNLLDLCALALPVGFVGTGGGDPKLPFGVTLIAAGFQDGFVGQVAREMEQRLKLPPGAAACAPSAVP